ncbi:MAG TPA: hypothetical protein VNA04_15570 [Thermoanaerobaculia bacterium]|nr:hypothetical protein [Thermoanaerobaculia bacterium]
MNDFFIGFIVLVLLFAVLMAVWGRLRRQVGGGLGPTELSDGSMTTTPTGYPEEMKGSGKRSGRPTTTPPGCKRDGRRRRLS